MPSNSDNHGYPIPLEGEVDWDDTLQQFIKDVDKDVIIVDDKGSRSNYTPNSDSILVDQTNGHIYIGNGSSWTHIPSTGDTPTFGSVTTQGDITDGPNSTTVYDQSAETVGDGSTTADHAVVDTDSLIIGGTLYEEDDNSPFTFTGQVSGTYTVSGSYDVIVAIPYDMDSGGGPNELRVNGDSGSNYTYVDTADSQTAGASQWSMPRPFNYERLVMQDELGDRITFGAQLTGSGTAVGFRGQNKNVSGPITQFTVLDSGGSSRDLKMRVYGRDLS
jgi:hypothetical protein